MRVEQVMTRPAQSCRPEDTLAHAAHLMWDRDCGCLPVTEGNGTERVVGIITDRDICMCALFEGAPLGALKVRQAMAKQVQICHPADSLAASERVMREARVRRLPVVDDNGMLVGMISLADIAQAAEPDDGGAPRDHAARGRNGICGDRTPAASPARRVVGPGTRRRRSAVVSGSSRLA